MRPSCTVAVAVRAAMYGGLLWFGLAGVAPPVLAAKDEATVADRVARLERTLGGSGLLELSRQLEALQQEVRHLRGEIENQAFTLEQLRKSQREAYGDADRRIGALEQGSTAAAGALPDPALSTLDGPTDAPVAGKPSEQTMTVDLQAPVGDMGGEPGAEAIDTRPEAAAALRPPGERSTMVLSPEDASPGTMRIAGAGTTSRDEFLSGAPTAAGGDPLLAPAPRSTTADTAPPASPRSETPESEAAYREAFGLLKGGQYEQAIAGFSAYLEHYPNGQYADNAQFWVGESYYVLRQFEPAIAQYQKLLTNYPDSQKQPHALLKIAYSFEELGRRDQAVQILNQLKQKYPDSSAARLADERLVRLRSAPAT